MVPQDTDTYYVVKYAAPVSKVVDTKTVTQHISYQYKDGITANRPELPQDDDQSLLFTRTVVRNPFTDAVISDSWSSAQQFTVMPTPEIAGYYYNQAQAGSDAAVTHESENTNYVVLYAPAKTSTTTKTVRQTIRYEYADGITAGRPQLQHRTCRR